MFLQNADIQSPDHIMTNTEGHKMNFITTAISNLKMTSVYIADHTKEGREKLSFTARLQFTIHPQLAEGIRGIMVDL
jgi:hypothetical protein